MAKKDQPRELRSGTVINKTSKGQEKDVDRALKQVVERLRQFSPIAMTHDKEWKLDAICTHLKKHFPDVDFHCHSAAAGSAPTAAFCAWLPMMVSRFQF